MILYELIPNISTYMETGEENTVFVDVVPTLKDAGLDSVIILNPILSY